MSLSALLCFISAGFGVLGLVVLARTSRESKIAKTCALLQVVTMTAGVFFAF